MTLASELKAIENLKGKTLKDKYLEVTGTQTRSNNRPYLIRKIAQALQRQAAEVKPKRNKAAAKPKKRDPRLPTPGTVLEREHAGKRVHVTVLEDGGFLYAGETYRSLSAVAKQASGTVWNGFEYFGLNTNAGHK